MFGFRRFHDRLAIIQIGLRADDLVDDLDAFVGKGVDKRGELPLGEHDGARKPFEVEAGEAADLFPHRMDRLLEHRFPAVDGKKRHPGVNISLGALGGPPGPIARVADREDDLGIAVGRPPVHHLFALGPEAGRPAVEGKTYRIENRCLSRSVGAGNGENPHLVQRGFFELDMVLPRQGIDVFHAYVQDFHDGHLRHDRKI